MAYRTATEAIAVARFGQTTSAAAFGANFKSVAAVQNQYGDVIVAGIDGQYGLWANTYSASTQSWRTASGPYGNFRGKPGMAIGADGTVKMAIRDSYNGIWYATYTPSGGLGNFQNLGGNFGANMSDPAVAITGMDGLFQVVVRDGWGNDQSGGYWFGKWPTGGAFQWLGAYGSGLGQPSVVAGSDSAMYVAIRDGWGGVWVARATGAAPAWFGPNGVVTGDPVIVHLVPPDNATYSYAVVVAPVYGVPYYKRYLEGSGNGWDSNPWPNAGGVLGALAAVSEKGVLYITGRDPGTTMWWWREGGSWQSLPGPASVAAGTVAATPNSSSGNRIYKLTANPTNVSSFPDPTKAWEPAAASNGAGEWAMAWNDIDPSSYVTGYFGWLSQGAWTVTRHEPPTNPKTSTGFVDVLLTFSDRFVFTGLKYDEIWWGVREAGAWSAKGRAMVYGDGPWDYPSIAEIAGSPRRTLVGAVKNQLTDTRFFSSLSINEGTFDTPAVVVNDSLTGASSRIFAAGQQFRAILPVVDGETHLPYRVMHCIENFSSTPKWLCSQLGGDFAQPANDSGEVNVVDRPIYYHPFPQVSGSKDGRWATIFPIQSNGVNNMVVCVSERGGYTNPPPCAILNLEPNDQFIGEVSAFPVAGQAGTTGYWFTYLTYPFGNPNNNISLIACYFTSGYDTPICHTAKSAMKAQEWRSRGRCGAYPHPFQCWAPGDYMQLASNKLMTSSIPMIYANGAASDLLQQFFAEPPGGIGSEDFVPNFKPIPTGANWAAYAGPVVRKSIGLPAFTRHQDIKLPARPAEK